MKTLMLQELKGAVWQNVDVILDWPQSSSQTFRTQFKPDFEPEVWGSGLAEYMNLNLLVGSGLSTGRTRTSLP